MIAYFNPYYNQDFVGFFQTLFYRLYLFATLQSTGPIASDELQLLVLSFVAATSAIVGCFLVFRKMTMLANSISHTILVGIVIAFLATRQVQKVNGELEHLFSAQSMLIAAVLMGLVTSLFTEFLTKTVKLQADASTGLVFSSFFAFGIVLVTLLTRSAHIGAEVVMGNVDALHFDDLTLVILIFCIILFITLIFYKEFLVTTFDSSFAKAIGVSPIVFNYLLMILVSLAIVSGFRAVGVIMVLSMIAGPSLSARLLTNKFHVMSILSVLLGILASCLGVAISRHMLSIWSVAFSTGGVVVSVISLQYLILIIFSPLNGLLIRFINKQKLKSLLGTIKK